MTSPRRIDPVLVIGDTLALLLFAAMGRAEHQTGVTPLGVLQTAAPFIAVWYGVGFWWRTFHPDRVATPLIAVRSVIIPWLLAWPLGLQLRALILERSIQFSFALVVLGTVLLLLAVWRCAYAVLKQRKRLTR